MNKTDDTRIKKLSGNVGVIIFLCSLLVIGFTLAYFSYTDIVTNKHSAKRLKIELLEPAWYTDTGMEAAKKQVPGMTITKDPHVYNKSEAKVYVRMKLEILDKGGKIITDKTNKTKIAAYLKSIYFIDKKDNKKKELFVFDTTDPTTPVSSQNSNFEYSSKDGWFYYKTENVYTELDAKSSTPNLFDEIHIPILKSEYNGIFDGNYTIKVIAQAISTEYKTDTDIIDAFNQQYGE